MIMIAQSPSGSTNEWTVNVMVGTEPIMHQRFRLLLMSSLEPRLLIIPTVIF